GVEDVPPSDPAQWEEGGVPLGRYFPAQPGAPSRIAVYRRPIESRAHDDQELVFIVLNVILEQVAPLLARRPDEVDPAYDFCQLTARPSRSRHKLRGHLGEAYCSKSSVASLSRAAGEMPGRSAIVCGSRSRVIAMPAATGSSASTSTPITSSSSIFDLIDTV